MMGAAKKKSKQRVALVGMTQEVAHQNPVPSTAEDFDMSRVRHLPSVLE